MGKSNATPAPTATGAPAGKFFNTPATTFPQYTSGAWANLPTGTWGNAASSPAPTPAPAPTPTPTPTPTHNPSSILDQWRAAHGLPPGGFVSILDLLRARRNGSQGLLGGGTTQPQWGWRGLFGQH